MESVTLPTVLVQAAADPALRPRDVQLFVVLCDELTTTYKPLKHSWLSRRTHADRTQVVRTLQRLTRRGYVESGPRDGSLRTYRLVA